jgi:hypothetical protein
MFFSALIRLTHRFSRFARRGRQGRVPARRTRARPRLDQLEERWMPAIIHWGNYQGGDWRIPGNWREQVVPGSGDTAVIDLPGVNVTFSSDNPQVAALTLSGDHSFLDVQAGTLRVTGALAISSNFTTTVDGGTLIDQGMSPNDFTVSGAGAELRVNSGTVSDPSDNLTILNGGTLTLHGGTVPYMTTLISANLDLGDNSATGAGLIVAHGISRLLGNVSAGQMVQVAGDVRFGGDATLTVAGGASNAGTILLESTAQDYTSNLTVAGSGAFTNAATGVIQANLGTGGARTITGSLTNTGNLTNQGLIDVDPRTLLRITTGVFEAAGGTNHGITYVVDAQIRVTASPPGGTTIYLGRNTTLVGDNLAGTTLQVAGDVRFGGDATLTVAGGASNAGTILLMSIAQDYASNLTVAGSGAFTNATGATIQVLVGTGGPRALTGSVVNRGTLGLGGNSLTVHGGDIINQPGALVEGTGTIALVSGATFQNLGTLRVPPGTLDITGDTFLNYDRTMHTLTGGTYEVTGTFQFDNVGIANNAATIVLTGEQSRFDALSALHVNTANGSISLRGGRNLPSVNAGFYNLGVLDIGAQCEFHVNGTLANFDSGTLTGGTWIVAGTLRFNGAAITTNAANIVLDKSDPGAVGLIVDQNDHDALANLQVNSSSLSFLGGRNFIDAGYFYDGGILTIGAGTTFTASYEYNEAGTAVIQAGGTLSIQGQLDNFDPTTGTLTGGAFRIAGRLQFAGAAILSNASDLTLDGPGASIGDLNPVSNNALTNFATNASAGRFTVLNMTYTISPAFLNLGTLTAGAGSTLVLSHELTQTGTLVVAAGATARASFRLHDFQTTTHTLGGGTYRIAGTFQFAAANVQNLAATLILDGPGAHIQDAGGAEGLNGFLSAVTASGALTLQNGAALRTADSGFANAGTVNLIGNGTTLTVSGDYTQVAGASTSLAGGTVMLTGTFVNNQGATLSGAGTITGNLMNAGLVHLDAGSAVAILTVTGNFTQTSDGVLELHLGLAGGRYDQLQVGGLATLAGTLTSLAPPDFAPNLGARFDVILCPGGHTGQFETVIVPDLGAELALVPDYTMPDRVSLVVQRQH